MAAPLSTTFSPRGILLAVLSAFFLIHSSGCVAPDRHVVEHAGEFVHFLDELDDANSRFIDGEPDAFLRLWSRSDDVTLSGGFGGVIEHGWDQVSERLAWVSTIYSGGTWNSERVAYGGNDGLAYLVQHEEIRFVTPAGEDAARDYRVTMVFRLEDDGWRILHRQADQHTEPAVPTSSP